MGIYRTINPAKAGIEHVGQGASHTNRLLVGKKPFIMKVDYVAE